MFVLSEEQVSFILDDIRRNGIELEELQLNLLDHICCIIENEMLPGQNFEEFYRKVVPRFFKKELGEIQEETDLLLTFKHYYAMKKVMLISGTIAAIGIFIGSLFRVMHWPGVAPMFLLSVFTLSFIFLPILFLLKSKELKVKREKVTLGIATIFGILVSVAILFKVMHWPGANITGTISLVTLIFIFLPIYFFGGIRDPETKTNTIVSSVLILFAGGLLFFLTGLRPSKQFYYLYASYTEEIHKSYEFVTAQNNLKITEIVKDTTKSQKDYFELKKLCDDLCTRIDSAKNLVIADASFGQNPKPSYEMLLGDYFGNYDLPTNQLYGNREIAIPLLVEIDTDIEKLKTLAKEKFHVENISILNTADVDDYWSNTIKKVSWDHAKFCRVPFELVMINFNQLELDVRIAEAACL